MMNDPETVLDEPKSASVPCTLYTLPISGKGRIGGKPPRPMQRGKMGCTCQPTQVCMPSTWLEQMFWRTGLGNRLGKVLGSWFRYGATLRNLVNTTMRLTRQSPQEALATLSAPLTGVQAEGGHRHTQPNTPARSGRAQPKPEPKHTHVHGAPQPGMADYKPSTHTNTHTHPNTPARSGGAQLKPQPKHTHPHHAPKPGLAG